MPLILKHYPRFDPYFMDWVNYMTVIEQNVWSDIRYLGLPFLPQFPVKRYFLDFADPVKKIGIEADGKRWHEGREIQDRERQEELEQDGWEIVRIQGWKTFKSRMNYFSWMEEEESSDPERYQESLGEFQRESSEGILTLVRDRFYR